MPRTPRQQNQDAERPKIASRDELIAFLEPLAALRDKSAEGIRPYILQFDRQTLQAFMGRAFADALKSPSQKLGTAKPPSAEAPPATKRRTATRKPRDPRRSR